jgi:hypothetical protein
MMPAAPRVVIYMRAGPGADTQQQRCMRHVLAQGYTLVAVATDGPGEHAGWVDATGMVSAGAADLVVIAANTVLPMPVPVEVAGMVEGGRRPRRVQGGQ